MSESNEARDIAEMVELIRSIPKPSPTVRRFFVHPDDLREMLREVETVPGPHAGHGAVMVLESPNALRGVAAAEMTDGTMRFIELRAGALDANADDHGRKST